MLNSFYIDPLKINLTNFGVLLNLTCLTYSDYLIYQSSSNIETSLHIKASTQIGAYSHMNPPQILTMLHILRLPYILRLPCISRLPHNYIRLYKIRYLKRFNIDIAPKTNESSPIWFLTFAEMVPQACLWCLLLFATLVRKLYFFGCFWSVVFVLGTNSLNLFHYNLPLKFLAFLASVE